jgi:hypothetical protein
LVDSDQYQYLCVKCKIMVHLIKNKENFHVVEVSPNHEIIKTSQSKGFTTRKGAYKNVIASAKIYLGESKPIGVLVQDDTAEAPRMIRLVLKDGKMAVEKTTTKPGTKFTTKKSPGRKAVRK